MDLQQIINPKEKLQDQNPYTIQKLSFEIDSAKQNFNEKYGTLSINNEYFQFIISDSQTENLDSLKIIYVSFSNISSIGISGFKLCVFLQGQNQEQLQNNQEDLGQDNINQQKQETVITLLKDAKAGNFNVTGNMTISIGFQNYNKSVLQQVHDILVQKLQSAQESDNEENDFMGEMINADSINEDGTINFDKINNFQQVQQNNQSSQCQEQEQIADQEPKSQQKK